MTTTEVAPDPAEVAVTRPERAGELVELSELLYRGIFSSGLLVASIMCGLAMLLAALQPPGAREAGLAVNAILLVLVLATLHRRAQAYRMLRLYPAAVLVPATVVGGGAWLVGTHNAQQFYVITLVLGVAGLTVPFRYLAAACLIAALGCAAPGLLSEHPRIGSTPIASVTIPTIFWVIIERLARFMLRSHETVRDRAATSEGEAGHESPATAAPGARRRWPMRIGGRRQRQLRSESGPVAPSPPVVLSARQLQIVLLSSEGLNHLDVARCLEIGPQQVRRHLRAARERTGSATTAELVVWAIRHGHVPRPPAPEQATEQGFSAT